MEVTADFEAQLAIVLKFGSISHDGEEYTFNPNEGWHKFFGCRKDECKVNNCLYSLVFNMYDRIISLG